MGRLVRGGGFVGVDVDEEGVVGSSSAVVVVADFLSLEFDTFGLDG